MYYMVWYGIGESYSYMTVHVSEHAPAAVSWHGGICLPHSVRNCSVLGQACLWTKDGTQATQSTAEDSTDSSCIPVNEGVQ